MPDTKDTGVGRVLKAMAFLLAAAVVVDYLLPAGGPFLWLAVGVVLLLALSLMVPSESRLLRNLQTLSLATMLSLAIAIIGVEIVFRMMMLL